MAQKTGYLSGDLKLFHLVDKRQWTCPYHYHDFDKITLFFQGHVSYDVEGTAYDLKALRHRRHSGRKNSPPDSHGRGSLRADHYLYFTDVLKKVSPARLSRRTDFFCVLFSHSPPAPGSRQPI